jgi:uncharacterized DUF497 family protein
MHAERYPVILVLYCCSYRCRFISALRMGCGQERGQPEEARGGLRAGAVLVFAGRMVWWPDLRRDYGEPRWAGLGEVEGRVYVVVWTMRGPDLYRIISARKANDREEKTYWG